MSRPTVVRWTIALATLVGCAKGVDNGFGGSFTASVGSTSPSTTNGGSEGTGDDGFPTSSISADASASDTSAEASSSASATADGSTSGVDAGESSSSGVGEEESTGGGSMTGMTSMTSNGSGNEESSSEDDGGNGGQPQDGMYSPCTMANNTCTMAPVTICVYTMTDGFCTADGCVNPAQDCDPSPGGTATPMCVPADVYSLCALDCSGGKTCPTGMTCQILTFDQVTNYEMCM